MLVWKLFEIVLSSFFGIKPARPTASRASTRSQSHSTIFRSEIVADWCAGIVTTRRSST
jgi:hypothetical protein